MGRDKALLELDGSSFLDRAVARLRRVADPVIIAGGSDWITRPACVSVVDPAPRCGPVGGLVAALRASPHPLCAVVAVDMPWLSPDVLARLAGLWDGEDAVVPVTAAGPEPLHAVYCRSALGHAEAALGSADLSARGLLGRLRVRQVAAAEVAAPAEAAFSENVNTPADWRRCRETSRTSGHCHDGRVMP